MKFYTIFFFITLLLHYQVTAAGSNITNTRRGSWVQNGKIQKGDVILVNKNHTCEIIISQSENSAVLQAAKFLSSDIEKLTGYLPPIVNTPSAAKTSIYLVTLPNKTVPAFVNKNYLQNKWEAYQIVTIGSSVWLAGSDFRGTAYAAYTLSERLGIDPLYLWTGYTPDKNYNLVLKRTDTTIHSPDVKYRGFFHDDEDILPRPLDKDGYPSATGSIDMIWYKRFFETALRLRMNMVAPYTRVLRRHEIQKLASDWGLFYTSHHYDILLSNPFGLTRFNLAKERGVTPEWNWFTNKEGIIKYWKYGVLENKDVDAIWPVGLRGTDDFSYKFPAGMSEKEQTGVFNEAISTQVNLVKSNLSKDKMPLFHFTLYTEMLDKYQTHRQQFNLPEDVMIIWPDNNNGIMRALPSDPGKWKHGVYYHLAYLGPRSITKQITHITSPDTITTEFKKIFNSGATTFILTNVSEMREYIMEARYIAELCWNGHKILSEKDAAGSYINWWVNEYFGSRASKTAALAYKEYYRLFNLPVKLWQGSDMVQELVQKILQKDSGVYY